MTTTPMMGRDGAALSLQGWALEMASAAEIAKWVAPTALTPDTLKVWVNPRERDPDKRQLDLDATVAQVAAVLLAGQELELDPMASLRAFVVIKGTVAMYAAAARGILQHRGHEVIVYESNDSRAIVQARRKGSQIWMSSTWDLDRAKKAGLYPGGELSNWRKHPKSMLVARATGEVCRWVASDALFGLLAEEVEDGVDQLLDELFPQLEPGPGPDGQQPPEPKAPDQPKATKTAKRTRTPRAALLPAGPPQPVPEPRAAEEPEEPKASKEQLARLHAALRAIKVTNRQQGLALVSNLADRPEGNPVTSTAQLTTAEISKVITRIETLAPIVSTDDDQPDPPPPDSELEDRTP